MRYLKKGLNKPKLNKNNEIGKNLKTKIFERKRTRNEKVIATNRAFKSNKK